MKKALRLWKIGGFIFTGTAGVLLHFLYDWTDRSVIVAPFSAVNESIWEHMKLLFFPMFIFSLIEYKFIGGKRRRLWCSESAGTIIGLILIPLIYYTYTGISGVNADWFNIIIFFIAAGTAYYLKYLLLKNEISFCKSSSAPFIVLCLIAVLFVVMTFVHPEIPLFKDNTSVFMQNISSKI